MGVEAGEPRSPEMGDAAGSPGGRPFIVCEARGAPGEKVPH